jgi:hypothetical protein
MLQNDICGLGCTHGKEPGAKVRGEMAESGPETMPSLGRRGGGRGGCDNYSEGWN